jgi:hypothetical protein
MINQLALNVLAHVKSAADLFGEYTNDWNTKQILDIYRRNDFA